MLEVLPLSAMAKVFRFIESLNEDEYSCLIRQFDKIELWVEFKEWEEL